MSPSGKGFARKIFKHTDGEFDIDGSGEYFVNLGLFNNEKVSALSMEVNDLANELGCLLPELPYINAAEKRQRMKQINGIYPTLRRKYYTLVNLTRGTLAKMDETTGKQTHKARIYSALALCRQPMHKTNLDKFCRNIFSYNSNLQKVGIVPITAGYGGQTGESQLYRQ